MNTKTRRGYSLVEISVAIAIIVVLFAMLFGFWGTISRRTKTVTCVSHLRQIMTAINTYAGAHDQRLPFISPDPFWADRIKPYLSSPQVFQCPEGIGNSEFYAGYDVNLFYDGKKPTTDFVTSSIFTNAGTVGFFTKRDASDPYAFQALKTDGLKPDGTFSVPVYLILANPMASPQMQEKYSIWKFFSDCGYYSNSYNGTVCINGQTPDDAKDSQYRVMLIHPGGNRLVVPDLREWAVRNGGTIVVGPILPGAGGINPSDFVFEFFALDSLVGIPVGNGGAFISDFDSISATASYPYPNWTNAGTPFHVTPVPPGVNMNQPLTNAGNGLWIWNEFINPSQIQVRTMFHTDNATIAPYFSYRYDLIVSDSPKLPSWYVPGAVPVTGTVTAAGSLQGLTVGISYGANNLAGNVRKGAPFTASELGGDTALLVDYGTLTINWYATDVAGVGNSVTITAEPTPPLFKRHIGGKVSVLKADGSVEPIDPALIPRGWWTPKSGD